MKKEMIILLLIVIVSTIVALYINYSNKNQDNENGEQSINYNMIYNGSNENIIVENIETSKENIDNQESNFLTFESEIEEENVTNTTMNVKKTNTSKYYIKVNNDDNKINIYEKDENGEYSILAREMICSVGTHTPPSKKYPKKTYRMDGQRYKWLYLQGDVYGQYATRITGHILFHSVPYKSKSQSSLEYWEFDKLGTAASLGCIRLQVADAKWIYDNISKGTTVEFNTDVTNEETAPKISENKSYRNWDPTDSSDQNPWNKK